MKMMNSKMRSTAIAALLSLPVASGAAFAQQSQGDDQTQQQNSQSQTATQQQSSQASDSSGQAAGTQQQDAVMATVGDAEILGSDVMTVIGTLPPQLQSQPPQMLVPIALQQLILRELILEEARSQNLADDPEVVALVEGSVQAAEEDAMVQIWLNRQMANAVTDEAVQQAYEGAQAQGQQDLPELSVVRPQIEQHLRGQAMQNLQAQLQEGADIVLYDAMGQPIEQQSGQDQSSQSNGNSDAQSSSNGSSGSSSSAESSSGETGPSGDSGEQTQSN